MSKIKSIDLSKEFSFFLSWPMSCPFVHKLPLFIIAAKNKNSKIKSSEDRIFPVPPPKPANCGMPLQIPFVFFQNLCYNNRREHIRRSAVNYIYKGDSL